MTVHTLRRAALGLTLLLSLFLVSATPALAKKQNAHRAGQLQALSQNLYIGAEVLGIALAPTFCDVMAAADAAVEQIKANDFTQRADVLAAQIAAESPDVVGLQEVYVVAQTAFPGGSTFFFENYLAILMAALADHGAAYSVAAIRTSAQIDVPGNADGDCSEIDPFPAIDYIGTIIDNDVILCREGVDCSAAAAANFQVNAGADTPAGPILIERGWVSVVATVKGRSYRVLNTHLEVDSTPSFRDVQFAQSVELAATLDAMRQDGLPQVAIGDFNSDDTPGLPVCDLAVPCFTSYQVMTAAGFHDAWLKRGGPDEDGFTCCQDEDPLNPDSAMSRRIDHVWVRGSLNHYGGPVLRGVKVDVLGTEQIDRTDPDGLWPSDHAGVIADLVLRTPK
jgi:endonuclease/exonuclease/phosphatase family metal-dependent hydrolase